MIAAGMHVVKTRSLSDEWRITPFGDVHWDNPGCYEKLNTNTLKTPMLFPNTASSIRILRRWVVTARVRHIAPVSGHY